MRHRRFDGIDNEEGFDLGWIEWDVVTPIDQLVALEDIERRRRSAAAELGARSEPTRRRIGLAEFAAKLRTCDFPHLDREEVERRAHRDQTMMHFGGTGPTWPIRPTPAGVCGGCQGKALDFRIYCLVCDRSGADHLIRPIPRLDPPRPEKPHKAARRVGPRWGPFSGVGSAERTGRRFKAPALLPSGRIYSREAPPKS